MVKCRGDGIGRHTGFKNLRAQAHGSSTLPRGTRQEKSKGFGSPRFARRLIHIEFSGQKRIHDFAFWGKKTNLSCVHKTTRLRISCDTKYPNLITRISESLKLLLPQNKVGTAKKKGNCIDVYTYSNHLENLLGWKAKGGSKFRQTVRVPKWVWKNKEYKIKCLRGLIETDGCIYNDRGYPMVIFSTIIPRLAEEVKKSIISLGFNPHKYRIPQKHGAPFKYQIRLSKDVQKFLDLVKPDKS